MFEKIKSHNEQIVRFGYFVLGLTGGVVGMLVMKTHFEKVIGRMFDVAISAGVMEEIEDAWNHPVI